VTAGSTTTTGPGALRGDPMPEISPGPAERLAYSVDEVALITGLSRDLLYDQMRTGRLGYIKVGRRRIITRQHLDAFLARAAS
jgi:excisionase family DNA binding protein